MASIFEALWQPFFVRSLIVVALLAVVFPLYGNLVVIRKEANISHSFAHIGLLWVAVGLRLNFPVQRSIIASVIVTVFLLYFLGYHQDKSATSINEITAQIGLVGAILIISQHYTNEFPLPLCEGRFPMVINIMLSQNRFRKSESIAK